MDKAEEILKRVSGLEKGTIDQSYKWVLKAMEEYKTESIKELEEIIFFIKKENNALIFDKATLVDKVESLKAEREELCKNAYLSGYDEVNYPPNFEEWKRKHLTKPSI